MDAEAGRAPGAGSPVPGKETGKSLPPGNGRDRRRILIALSGAAALAMMGISMAVARLMSRLVELSGSDAQIGWLASAFAVSYILLQVPYGNLSDRYGFKPFLIFGLLLAGGSGLLYRLADSRLLIFLGRAVQGAGEATIWSLAPALLSLLYPERKGWVIGLYSVFLYAGILAGPLLVPLTPFLDGPGVFLACSGACAGAAGIVALFVENRRPEARSAEAFRLGGALRLAGSRPVRLALAGIGLYGAAQGLFFALIPGYLIASRGFSPLEGGYLLSVMYLGTTLAQLVVGPLSDRRGRRPFMILGLLVGGAATATFAPFGKIPSMILLGLGTAGMGGFFVASMAYLNEKAPESLKGTVSGAYYVFWGLGYFAGPLLWGALGQAIGRPASYLCFGLVLAAEAALLGLFAREEEPAVPRDLPHPA